MKAIFAACLCFLAAVSAHAAAGVTVVPAGSGGGSGGNWTASGVTNSSLPGILRANGGIFTNSLTLNGVTITNWPSGSSGPWTLSGNTISSVVPTNDVLLRGGLTITNIAKTSGLTFDLSLPAAAYGTLSNTSAGAYYIDTTNSLHGLDIQVTGRAAVNALIGISSSVGGGSGSIQPNFHSTALQGEAASSWTEYNIGAKGYADQNYDGQITIGSLGIADWSGGANYGNMIGVWGLITSVGSDPTGHNPIPSAVLADNADSSIPLYTGRHNESDVVFRVASSGAITTADSLTTGAPTGGTAAEWKVGVNGSVPHIDISGTGYDLATGAGGMVGTVINTTGASAGVPLVLSGTNPTNAIPSYGGEPIVIINTNYTILYTDNRKFFKVTSATNVTWTFADGATNGFGITIKNLGAGSVIITNASGKTFDGQTSVSLPAMTISRWIGDGTNYTGGRSSGNNLVGGNKIFASPANGTTNLMTARPLGADDFIGTSNRITTGLKFLSAGSVVISNTLVIGTGGRNITTNAPFTIDPLPGETNGTYAGQQNVVIGTTTGDDLTTGNGNTFVGEETGTHNTTGSQNTYIGWTAGRDGTTGYHNTYIGVGAGMHDTTTNSAYNTIVGVDAGLNFAGGQYNTLIGNTSGNQSGGNNNTFVGYASGLPVTNINNVFIGTGAGSLATNSLKSVGIGGSAGRINQSPYNVFIGDEAGLVNNSGSNNVFIGRNAGHALTTNNLSTLIGAQSGGLLASGIGNTGIGAQTLNTATSGDGNSFFGYQNLFRSVTGAYNTSGGYQAGFPVLGSSNTIVGAAAGFTLTNGGNNTLIGTKADVASGGTLEQGIAIGALAKVTNSFEAVIGGPAVTNVVSPGSFTSPIGFGSRGAGTVTTSATGATNTSRVNVILYVTAATGAALVDSAGTTEFSGVTMTSFTPIRLQPNGTFIGTAITYATGTSSHAW